MAKIFTVIKFRSSQTQKLCFEGIKFCGSFNQKLGVVCTNSCEYYISRFTQPNIVFCEY